MNRISIIIPSFNQAQFIEKTITSLLDQNYPNLEIIVMDGGSTDSTISILRKYDSKILWFSEKDKGQSNAINKGLEISTGEILGFLNSDDFLLPGTLRLINDSFSDERTLWITGDYVIVDENEKQIQSLIVKYKHLLRRFSSKNLLLITNYIVQPSTFWRRILTNQIGSLDETLQFVMDYDYWLRSFKISKPKIVNIPISGFRIHKKSKGGSQFKKQFEEELKICYRYTSSKIIRFLHKVHNYLIVISYRLLK